MDYVNGNALCNEFDDWLRGTRKFCDAGWFSDALCKLEAEFLKIEFSFWVVLGEIEKAKMF